MKIRSILVINVTTQKPKKIPNCTEESVQSNNTLWTVILGKSHFPACCTGKPLIHSPRGDNAEVQTA